MPGDYSLQNVMERIYHNQLALEAAIMELALWVEQRGSAEEGGNIRGALEAIDANAGHIKQGLSRLKGAVSDSHQCRGRSLVAYGNITMANTNANAGQRSAPPGLDNRSLHLGQSRPQLLP